MAHLNGKSLNLLILSMGNDPQFVQQIRSHLDSVKYHIRAANTLEEAEQLLKIYMPKAIIAAGDCDTVAAFFKATQDRYRNQADCPVMVFVSDQPALDLAADLVIPPAWLHQINHYLSSTMTLRVEHAQLELNFQKLNEENHRLKGQLQHHEKSSDDMNFLKNAIVSNVAHELRTPLLQVKSAVALLAEDVGNNAVLVDLAMGATTRLETVVKDITLLNDLINESQETRPFEPVLMREVLDFALRNLRRSWQHKNEMDRVKINMVDHLPPAFGDKQRLVITLQLLIDNGLKFSKGPVEVIIEQVSSKIRVTVRDEGIGIPQDKVEKVFDTFYQVDNSTTKRYGGMGIGLAIVRYILERHHTKINVETEEGKGSTFWFELETVEVRTI
jgi:signal transduction histidine kinase